MRKLVVIVLCFVGVLLAGYAGYRSYRVWKNKHLMWLAGEFDAQGKTREAMLSLEAVLRTKPNDLVAVREMAGLLDKTHSPLALTWRNRVVELNPHSLQDRLSFAQTALGMRDYVDATNVLDGVDAADKKTAAYHNIAGAVAAAGNHTAEAEMHFIESSRLEPGNLSPQLNLAVLRLHDTNGTGSDMTSARSTLQELAGNRTNSTLRCDALRELILDDMAHKQENAAIALSKQLVQETNSGFTDRIMRLEVLRESKSPEFKADLADCQQEAASDSGKIYELGTWDMTKYSPADALGWIRRLPALTQTNQPTALLEAECYMAMADWAGLSSCIEKQRWGELDFLRHGMMARAMRGKGMEGTSSGEWQQAIQATDNQKQKLVMLLKLTSQWGWTAEDKDLLWIIVKQYPQERWAYQVLARSLLTGGQTQGLMQLFRLELQRNPADILAKNNLAMVALLLDVKDLNPNELALEVYKVAPTNSAFATTYAYSLYRQGKSADALKVMKDIKPEDRERPSIAGYYGIILQATGSGAQAGPYLNRAIKSHLLPEEQKIFQQASASRS